jgi:TonB family protein
MINLNRLFMYLTLIVLGTNLLQAKNYNSFILNDSINYSDRDTNYYAFVDENASFLGGSINEFNDYVKKNLIYPESARNNKIEGKVIIQFGINCFGDLGYIKVMRSSGNSELDNEAIRVVNTSPKWIPAKIGKKFVGMNFITVVNFKL